MARAFVDCRMVYDLYAHPGVIQKMASSYGPDLLLWRSLFWVKGPGGPETPWHQDFQSWPMGHGHRYEQSGSGRAQTRPVLSARRENLALRRG